MVEKRTVMREIRRKEVLYLPGEPGDRIYLLKRGVVKISALPEDVQKILTETAKETQGFVYETAAALEVDLLNKLKDGGITVNEADKAAFIAASKPIYEEFASSVQGGGDLIETVLGLGN